MKILSLFSGCGGFEYGARLAKCKVVASIEIEDLFCKTLKKHKLAEKVISAPIQDIEVFPSAEMIIGGYPCQSFSIGGNRNPESDARTYLYKEYARALRQVKPKYFIAENVDGLQKVSEGKYLHDQLALFGNLKGVGYNVTATRVNVQDYGIPQSRKRLFIIGIRKDLGVHFKFPSPTHGDPSKIKRTLLKPHTSHGEVIKHLPMWPKGEFYERPHDPEGHFSWYYMSRNRRARWDEPSFTVVANWRHITLHPASPKMTLTWSDLKNGWKQRWDFSKQFDHLEFSDYPKMPEPRRLSWREAACIQSFPTNFNPEGSTEDKFTQIGNAVPPKMASILIQAMINQNNFREIEYQPIQGLLELKQG